MDLIQWWIHIQLPSVIFPFHANKDQGNVDVEKVFVWAPVFVATLKWKNIKLTQLKVVGFEALELLVPGGIMYFRPRIWE